ncbi:MAG: aminoacyltransferase [Lactobacillales bacterium]|jgi:serine/alanine adding enzyme|nr:aminoacyltransferase [Lactobacillales bacterium]
MYEFKINIDEQAHDAFVKTSPYANLLQSSAWAKVKDNWGHVIVGVYEDGKLVASALVLIKTLPLGLTMLYTPRGAIMDYLNRPLVHFFMENLKKYGKTKKALFLKMDPTIHYRDFHVGEDQVINGEAEKKIQTLISCGAKWQGLTMAMDETIQPRFQANVYKEDFDEESFTKKTRQMLRTARNKGVKVRLGGKEFIPEFAQIMEKTSERKHIALRQKEYFEKLLNAYPEDAFIMLAELNLKELFEATKKRYDDNETALAKLKENQVKKRHNLEELRTSLIREVNELEEKMNQFGDTVVIAGTLSIVFGKTSEILYAGMDESYKRYMPAYLTWFETIKECFNRGAETSNMGGLEGTLNDGLLQFKNNFLPTIEEFAGEFDLPINKLLFSMSEYFYKLRKKKH